mgnify:FL=1
MSMVGQSSEKQLSQLLQRLSASAGSADIAQGIAPGIPTGIVRDIVIDARRINSGCVWFALPGADRHGASFLDQAPELPMAIITDDAGRRLLAPYAGPIFVVADPRAALGPACAWLYDFPAAAMTMVAVTGTNGKTSVTHFLADAWRACGHAGAVLGTLGLQISGNDEPVEFGFTTPEADTLQRVLRKAHDLGVSHMAMEVSSHALALHRADGIEFDVAVFTNLSQDHLDYHTDMEDYFNAKSRLFADGRCRRAVVCVDDEWGRRLAADLAARDIPVLTYGLSDGDWRIISRTGSAVSVDASGTKVDLPTVSRGEFTALNVVAAAATLSMLEVAVGELPHVLGACRPVPGRMEVLPGPSAQHPQVVVDYAHSPDAVARVLSAARPEQGRLIAVLGAGGGRDRGKRPLMGAAASVADVVVVTDDNPRDENPAEIRAAVIGGVTSVDVREVADRREAIHSALSLARTGDVVAILGKGAERGQQYGSEVREFDDREVAACALAEWVDGSC